jgi:hypothetical protein
VKLLRSTDDHLVFQLGKREKRLLLDVLKLYPRIPPAHQKLTKSGRLSDQEASQKLLDEALAEQRADHKRQLQAFLADPNRFQESDTGCLLSLSAVDLEFLLQILNDIRVGSWIILGSPDPISELKLLNPRTGPDLWAMEMSGYFQMHLLESLQGSAD